MLIDGQWQSLWGEGFYFSAWYSLDNVIQVGDYKSYGAYTIPFTRVGSPGEASDLYETVEKRSDNGEVISAGDVSVNFTDVLLPELTVDFDVYQPVNDERFDGSITIKLFDDL